MPQTDLRVIKTLKQIDNALLTLLSDMPHFFAASGQDIYSIPIRPFYELTIFIIYGKPYNSNGQ